MNADEALAPAVREILAGAWARDPPDGGGIEVDARSLPAALATAAGDGRVPVIAEVKPTSPTSEGRRDDDPVDLATAMVDGGAAALSVLTEPEHFGGSPGALRRVRDAVDVPVLRKDFVLDERELDRVAADVALVVARFVDDVEGLVAAARERGFQVLVEVHTRAELETALAAGTDVVGVNNRDLARLEVDLGTFERVAPEARRLCRPGQSSGEAARRAPDDVTLIAESGVRTREDVRRMRAAGADGLLVGSAIMDGDVETNTRRLINA